MEPWIQTYTGIKFDYLNPTVDMIELEDIAHALSLQCRYAGHCRYFYSIAEHCVLVSHLVPQQFRFAALMYDAAEAYMTDIPSPLKQLMPTFSIKEKRIHDVICQAFGIEISKFDYMTYIKPADLQAIRYETDALVPAPHVDNWVDDLPKKTIHYELQMFSPSTAKALFIKTFYELIVEQHDIIDAA